jgi:hypothetical protein
MFIKSNTRGRKAGWTLVEMMFAAGIFTIVGGAIGSAYMFSIRSFQVLCHYNVLDQQNRQAMDRLTREIREANTVVNYQNGDNSFLSLKDGTGNDVTYSFNSGSGQMVRTANGQSSVLLNDCSLIKFNLGMRPPSTNYGYYPTTDQNEAKLVDLTWKSSLTALGGIKNSENIQTARIVIRKQKVSVQ